MSKRTAIITIFLIQATIMSAQLHVGIFGDVNKNFISYDKGYYGHYPDNIQFQDRFGKTICGGGYLSLRYDMNKLIALRTDLEMQTIKSTNTFCFLQSSSIITYRHYVLSKYHFTIPVMGEAYIKVGKWELYECAGFYGSLYKNNMTSLKGYDVGFTNCVGAGIALLKNISLNSEFKYYHGFIDQHNTGSKYFKQPIYNDILELSIGISYEFSTK